MRVYESALPTTLKATAAALALIFADDAGENVYPSLARVGWLMSKSARAASSDVNDLRRMGVLVAESSNKGGRRRSTRYRFNADALPKRPAFEKPRSSLRGCMDINHEEGFVVNNGNHEARRNDPRSSKQETRKPTAENREARFVGSVNEPSIDPVPDPSIDKTAAQTPRFSSQAKEPNGDNFAVIKKIALEVLDENRHFGRAAHNGEFIEAVKQRCADLRIDYGRAESVPFNVVHRSCAWAQIQRFKAASGVADATGQRKRRA